VTFGMLEAKLLCGERCYGHLIPAPHGGGAAGAAQGAADTTAQVMDTMFWGCWVKYDLYGWGGAFFYQISGAGEARRPHPRDSSTCSSRAPTQSRFHLLRATISRRVVVAPDARHTVCARPRPRPSAATRPASGARMIWCASCAADNGYSFLFFCAGWLSTTAFSTNEEGGVPRRSTQAGEGRLPLPFLTVLAGRAFEKHLHRKRMMSESQAKLFASKTVFSSAVRKIRHRNDRAQAVSTRLLTRRVQPSTSTKTFANYKMPPALSLSPCGVGASAGAHSSHPGAVLKCLSPFPLPQRGGSSEGCQESPRFNLTLA
jgi:hypothetical protein